MLYKKMSNKQRKSTPNDQKIFQKVIKAMDKKKQEKWYEFYSTYGQTASWIFNDLTGAITQGISVSQRIGMSIRIKHVKIRMTCTIGDPTQVMRFVLFRWKVSDTSDVPGDTELFTATGLASYPVMAPILPVKPSRFQIVKDHTITMSTNWKPVQTLIFDIPLNWDVEYDIGVNTGKEHLWLATCGDSNVLPHPSWVHEIVVHYHDTE